MQNGADFYFAFFCEHHKIVVEDSNYSLLDRECSISVYCLWYIEYLVCNTLLSEAVTCL